MSINELINFLKRKGFKDTFQILIEVKNNRVETREFNRELNKFSYYNSFFRVKADLIKKELIVIEQKNSKKFIRLTEKGLKVYNKLVEINDIINNITEL